MLRLGASPTATPSARSCRDTEPSRHSPLAGTTSAAGRTTAQTPNARNKLLLLLLELLLLLLLLLQLLLLFL